MSRWQPNTRARLQSAALELFAERGFAATTVPEITARAGLTTRTFFRHFADKREVLFADEIDVPALASRLIAEAPASHSPMRIIAASLETVAEAQFSGGVERFLARKAIIRSDEGLRERETHMMTRLSDALRSGFVARGVDETTAQLTAQITLAVFGTAIGRWLGQGAADDLPEILHDTLARLRTIMSDDGWEARH